MDIGVSLYAAAKAGAIGFTRHLAIETARRGVTANTISLGLVLPDPSALPELARTIPVGRLGEPGDVGALAVYLASPEAAWMTGQTVNLNGGAITS
jgi:NAD(P)-dependent dehydrogenase (short-subunit alcohol dehydrogenase family)